jgi:hypothetical protein
VEYTDKLANEGSRAVCQPMTSASPAPNDLDPGYTDSREKDWLASPDLITDQVTDSHQVCTYSQSWLFVYKFSCPLSIMSQVG